MSKLETTAISTLNSLRDKVGINKENVFVFSAPTRDSVNFLRGNDAMRKILNCVPEIECPERIRSTAMRKYCATVRQLADLDENSMRWLADHLGHNLDVHREFYRLRESTIEITKVARLLCAMDEGNVSQFETN